MEINLLDLVISVLQDNVKLLNKIEKYYDRSKTVFDDFAKEHRLDITKVSDRIKTVILLREEKDILSLIGDSFASVKNCIQKGLRYQQTVTKSIKPTDITKDFAIYKFFELLLDKWQDYDDYEKCLCALIYHDINKTRLKDFKPNFTLKMTKEADKRSMISAFSGASQLYSYVYELLLHDNMSMAEVEQVKLTAKDYRDITYEMAILIEVNKRVQRETQEGQLDFNLTDETQDMTQIYILILIGILVKVFMKLYLQKQQELKAVKPEKEIIYKEDLESKQLLSVKQEALNKLQLSYDKQQNKLAAVTEELQNMKEYVEIIEKIQEMEEQQRELNPNVKPVIPYQKGVILFGGHPNFQKKFAEKYGWVKIINADDIRIDWNLVKNASLVLINWKHLSHRQFYKLISVVRENKKELQYVW